MDYVKPADVAAAMIETGRRKLATRPLDLLTRSTLAGALLGISTSLALTATQTTTQPIVGALIFPIGLVMIVLLGLELVTGSFAIVPLPLLEGQTTFGKVLANLGIVYAGNLIGSVLYGLMLYAVLTMSGSAEPTGIAPLIVKAAEAKTTAYAAHGSAGMLTAFVKAILCNWMVCFAVVFAMSSTSAIGKIVTAWLPITVFFAQGFEHAVVNMFMIPTGMLLGAHVSLTDWWLWNQIPVTLGNIVGGLIFAGLAVYLTHRQPAAVEPVAPVAQRAA